MIELNGTKFFSKQEVSERLQMSPYTLNNKVCQQKIKGTRFGRYVYYTEQDMLNIIDPSGALYRAIVEAARTTATQEAGAGLIEGEGEPESESPEALGEENPAQPERTPAKKKRKPRKKATAAPVPDNKPTISEIKKARQAWGVVAPDWGEITNDWGEVAPDWNTEQ